MLCKITTIHEVRFEDNLWKVFKVGDFIEIFHQGVLDFVEAMSLSCT